MRNENKNVEENEMQMISIALQQFFNEEDVRVSIDFFDDGKVKKIIIEKRQEDAVLNNTASLSVSATKLELEREVTNLIKKIGIPAHIKGYRYIRTAILLSIKDSEMLEFITKNLYPQIAKQYKTKPSSVERAIRHAIEVACSKGNIELIDGFFGNTISPDRGKPTNSQFIAQIVDYFKMQLNL